MMNVIEMMVDKQAVLVVHMEVDDVTKEIRKVDWDHLDFCIYHLYFQINLKDLSL